jgi:heterodisulfide reductase subunit A-like polyferredoxin
MEILSQSEKISPKKSSTPVGAVMVVGAGIAGIQAALDLANAGYYVYLVEKSSAIGGLMAQLDKTFPTNDCSMCILSPKLAEAGQHLNIELLTQSELMALSGEPGNFTARLKRNPRFIDLSKCTSCGECAKVCPVDRKDEYDEGLSMRKAAFKAYSQAIPGAYAIEKRGTAPCREACPARVNVQGFIALMNQKRYAEAVALFKEVHPFPGVCGRVCNHPCETACLRNTVDQPLSIAHLHRFLADWDQSQKVPFFPKKKEERKEKAAVIGSGPAGLTCAYFLALSGYRVTVFEKLPVLGGMLSVGIPAYRLPREVIAAEIQSIRDLGVTLHTGVELGKDITVAQLREEGYKAVFLGIGSHECKVLGIPGEDLEGVYPGVDFLREINLGNEVVLGDRVIVIGGGDVAMDSVRTALRNGSKHPMVVYRRSEAEMPASKEEIHECREENIEIMTLTAPIRVVGENGRMVGLECIRMELGKPDISGRRRPVPIAGSEFIIAADAVIPAIGQESDWACLTDECACTLSDWGTMQVDPVTLQTKDADIFAGGDAVTGPATVVEAIAAGQQAAESIDRYIKGIDLYAGRETGHPVVEKVPTEGVAKSVRQPMPSLDAKTRVTHFNEVQLGYDAETSGVESDRCLACGICCECRQCVEACLADAIDHSQAESSLDIKVGSVILALGSQPFNPDTLGKVYYYGRNPNVLTSLEFERLLSASGPTLGHLVRPSDQKEPKKIAWLQCVGSRDQNLSNNTFCSSVCCMYAAKQTVIAKEHSKEPLDTTVFYMDLRTHGKDFDKYCTRAESENGVRFIQARVHTILPLSDDSLELRYVAQSGELVKERFDMVILSIGLSPKGEAAELAQRLGIELNAHGFARTSDLSPVATSRDGVYVCGTFQGPKDIPQSVSEASAAAAEAARSLSSARGSMVRIRRIPPERNVMDEPPRIGVFVCHCGINIGGVADVPAVRDYAAGLPNVVHVEDNLFSCSTDSLDHIKQIIAEKGINRVVVASCSPRTHEPLFQKSIREAGLNSYLFEMANIRDQNTWVHANNPEIATKKAKDLVRMAIAKAAWVEPLHQVSIGVEPSVLVVGGGVAGMETAKAVADQGFTVYLVEKSGTLGGVAKQLQSTWQGEPISDYLNDLIQKVYDHEHIRLFLHTETVATTGVLGNFSTDLITGKERLTSTTITHGATVIATGGKEAIPTEHLYGAHPNVMTQLDLDAKWRKDRDQFKEIQTAIFIQCVGSRTPERPYCSRVCCTHSLKNAIALKEMNPDINVFILYRDIRSYGLRETLYTEARQKGVVFIRYNMEHLPKVGTDGDAATLFVEVVDPILNRPVIIQSDLLVLASAILPNENRELFEQFKVPVNSDGFLVEAHVKLRPVDFASDGIFLAGLAHGPKSIDETIAQAKAAASRALTIITRKSIQVGGVVAHVREPDSCACCLVCVRSCPYGVPVISDMHAVIEAAQCHGCGICAAECPAKVITLQHYKDEQLLSKSSAYFLDEEKICISTS